MEALLVRVIREIPMRWKRLPVRFLRHPDSFFDHTGKFWISSDLPPGCRVALPEPDAARLIPARVATYALFDEE